ncbi:hypothetical protein NE237_031449 [Protea cynaroides]|uniref:Uncharacterized protein n=1 Tax=Protea cynaroides TaxID=273540 RepID=A0A9Q0L1G6_9MAGN|nr:hypothetical protein NE237_031449 [Protea cynaroides]
MVFIGQQKVEPSLNKEFKNHWEALKEMVAMELESLGINIHAVSNNQEETKEWIIRKKHRPVEIERQNKKKKKMENSSILESRKKMKITQMKDARPQPTLATMPGHLWNAINEYGGDDVMWVIEKTLTATDVSWDHNRLSIPENQVRSEKFLTDVERRHASQKEIPVDVLVLGMGGEESELWSMVLKDGR